MGLLEKQFDIWKLERMWKMGEPLTDNASESLEYRLAFNDGLDAAIEALNQFEESDGWIENRAKDIRTAINLARRNET